MTKINVPKLRFKGFDNEWKAEKIREISDTFSGGTPNVNDKDNYGGNIPFIRSSDINKKDLELYLTDEGIQSSSAKLVKKGTLLVALYGATSGKTGISKVDGAINQAILAILPKEGFNKLYIYSLLNYKKNEIINKYIQGGQGNLSGKIINDLNYFYPNSNEQQVIGSFFVKIDKLIELQTQKLEQLKKLKQGYLQKLFPENGESLPRFRFSGFSGEWKEDKIGNLVRECEDYEVKNPEEYKSLKVSLHFKGVQATNDHPRVTSKGRKYYVRKPGELIIGKQNFHNGGFAIIPDNINGYVASSAVVSFVNKNNCNLKWLNYYMMNTDWLRRTTVLIGGTGQKEYSVKILKSLKVMVPSLNEQQKIDKFLSELNEMINYQYDKIKSFKQQKKAYLQKMFI